MHGAFGVRVVFLMLYIVTLGCMAYCAMCDPGQLSRDHLRVAHPNIQDSEEAPPTRRAHKTWLYKLPIRRYDHYCRWLTNCIGLLNHREFVVMCLGLVSIGGLGFMLDFLLLLEQVRAGARLSMDMFLLLHLFYSACVVTLAGPILRLHLGFVSRDELAQEWKNNLFYVTLSAKSGKLVAVNDLSDNEFNETFDSFEYDPARNPFDRGLWMNLWNFWCIPRWTTGQLGDF